MITIIDYGMGNLGSMHNMLKKIGAEAVVSSDKDVISKSAKLILPGVGSFDAGMGRLKEKGLITVLEERVLGAKIPIMGVCLGMQLLCNGSEEGDMPGLGWVHAETVRFKFKEEMAHLKIPHMGWNQINIKKSTPLLADLESDNRFYFVHSYHVVCSEPENILSTTSYGTDFTSAIINDNVMGVQFHPEKSHKFGMKLLKNFAECV